MYKSTSRSMQRSRGRDCSNAAQKSRPLASRKYRKPAVRARWHPVVARVVDEMNMLPERLPFWLAVEIRALGVKRWLAIHQPKPKAKATRPGRGAPKGKSDDALHRLVDALVHLTDAPKPGRKIKR